MLEIAAVQCLKLTGILSKWTIAPEMVRGLFNSTIIVYYCGRTLKMGNTLYTSTCRSTRPTQNGRSVKR